MAGTKIKLEWFRYKKEATLRAGVLYPDVGFNAIPIYIMHTKNNQGKWGWAVILPKRYRR